MSTETGDQQQSDLEAEKFSAEYTANRLDEQRKQRDRLDARTSLLITSSASLIMVIGIVRALLPQESQYPVVLVFVAAIVFELAAIIVAQLAARSADHEEELILEREEKDGHPHPRWSHAKWLEKERDHNCKEWTAFWYENRRRMTWLRWAGRCHVFGVVALGCSLAMLVIQNPG